jgi:hypothetical protein
MQTLFIGFTVDVTHTKNPDRTYLNVKIAILEAGYRIVNLKI